MRRHYKALTLALFMVFGGTMFAFGQMSTSGRVPLADPLGNVYVQMIGPGATSTTAPTGTDSRTSQSKTAGVHKLTLTGNSDTGQGSAVSREIDVLYRVQQSQGSVWIDFVYDSTITSLSNTVGAMDLANGVQGALQNMKTGHPSTLKDAIDKQALVSAGGS